MSVPTAQESIDASQLQRIVAPPTGTKWGSLKSLEKVLASKIPPEDARRVMGPLFAVYELRLADARLAKKETQESLALVGVDESAPFVFQGLQLLDSCISAIYEIARIFAGWKQKQRN